MVDQLLRRNRMKMLWEVVVVVVVALLVAARTTEAFNLWENWAACESWRLAAETNNIKGWASVPSKCGRTVASYMLGGQYQSDIGFTVNTSILLSQKVTPSPNGKDAWILDVDETCISNLAYYQTKKYGVDPYNARDFKIWALGATSPAIPQVLSLFKNLTARGFKVILLSGRGEDEFREATAKNLRNQGFVGYHMLILRNQSYIGQSALSFKSAIRTKLVADGYKIWGNVGDQWSDISGNNTGVLTIKIPNPMYYVP